MIDPYPAVTRKINQLLDPLHDTVKMAHFLLDQIRHAKADGREMDVKKHAARYGGFVKRWQSWLIQEITSTVIIPGVNSRESVRRWQKTAFGKSIASSELKQYAVPEHSGGGRVTHLLDPNDEVGMEAAREYYKKHKNDIKNV